MYLFGTTIKQKLLEEIREAVHALPFQPVFTDIVVGDDPASLQYARMKKRTALSLGIAYKDMFFDAHVGEDAVVQAITELQSYPHMAGIIVQLPLPASYNATRLLNAVPPKLDVDVLGEQATRQFYNNEASLSLPTADAVMRLLDEAGVDYSREKFVVVGRGMLVGKPVAHLLKQRGAHVEVISRETNSEDKKKILSQADVIVTATGVPASLTGDMIREGVVVVDAGTAEMEGSVVGDVHMESVFPKAKYVTPTPGGVGPVTVACLFYNVLSSARRLYE